MFKGLIDKIKTRGTDVTPLHDANSVYAQTARQYRRAPEPRTPSGEFRAVRLDEIVVEHPIIAPD